MKWQLQKVLYRVLHAVMDVIIRLLKFRGPELSTGPGGLRESPERIHEKGLPDLLLVTDKGITRIGGKAQAWTLPFPWSAQELILGK